jgi:hypothetical protein
MPVSASSSRRVGSIAVPQLRATSAASAGPVPSASNTPRRVATITVRAQAKARCVSTSGVGMRPARSASHSSGVSAMTPSRTSADPRRHDHR